MVKAIFLAAKNEDAVLFFDEADSLLSQEDFVKACDKIEAEKAALAAAKDHTKSETSDLIKKALAEKIKQKSEEEEKNVSELTE